MTNDLARVQNLLMEASSLIFKLAGESDVPKQVAQDNRKKLSKRDVLRIREMKRNGCTQADIAECFDINKSTVSRIIRGHYWK